MNDCQEQKEKNSTSYWVVCRLCLMKSVTVYFIRSQYTMLSISPSYRSYSLNLWHSK